MSLIHQMLKYGNFVGGGNSGSGGGGVQPDWNQNDETAADYVKNRPLWTETIPQKIEIPPERFELDGPAYACLDFELESLILPANGVEIKVTFEGDEVSIPYKAQRGVCLVGDDPAAFWGGDITYGFTAELHRDEEFCYVNIFTKSAPTRPFIISFNGEQLHKVETKFLPVQLRKFTYDADADEEIFEDVSGQIVVYSEFDILNNPQSVTVMESGELYVPGAAGGNVKQYRLGNTYFLLDGYNDRPVGYTWNWNSIHVSLFIAENGIGPHAHPCIEVWAANSNAGPSYIVPFTQYAKDHFDTATVEWTGVFCTKEGYVLSVYVSRNEDGTANVAITRRL